MPQTTPRPSARSGSPTLATSRHQRRSQTASTGPPDMMAGARDRPSSGAWTTPAAASTAAARLGDAAAHQPAQSQQPQQPASTATTTPAGLLIVDMPHLRQGLERYFPQLVASQGGGGGADGGALPLDPDADESLAVLLPSVVASLEVAYGTRFTKRVLHDSSPTGKASPLAAQLAALGGFKVRAHQQKATEAVVVDPDTLEPRRHTEEEEEELEGAGAGERKAAHHPRGPLSKEKSWTLQDSSANVGMTLDVIKYAAAAKVVVVVSARPELAETLQHLMLDGEEEEGEPAGPTANRSSSSHSSSSSPPPPAVFVCALGREVAGTPLERWLKPQPQQQQQQAKPLTLERVLASAAEALWTRGRRNRRTAGLCPKGTACGHLRGTTAEAGAGGAGSPRPFTAHKLTHLCEYLHPCGQGASGCAAAGPLHRLAFIHGGSGNRSSNGAGLSSGRPTQALPLLPPPATGRAQQLATSATLHNRLPLHHHYRPAYQQAVAPPQPKQQPHQQQQQQQPSGRSPPLDVPAPRPLKPTGSGSLLRELALECGGGGGGGFPAEEELCMSPLSKAARQSSLWWYEAHRQQQLQHQHKGALGGEPEGEEQEWGDEDALGREHGAIFPMSL